MKTESMSTCRIRWVGHYEGLCFCMSSYAQKKLLVCSKCDDQNFLKFAQHLHSVPVSVCCKFKNKVWPLASVNVW